MCVITLRKVPRILTPFYFNSDYLKYALPRPNYRSFFPSVSESDCLFSRCRSSSSSMFHSRALVQASSQPDVEAKVQKSEKSSIRFSSALSRSIAASSCLPSPPLINVSSCHFVPSGRVSARVSFIPSGRVSARLLCRSPLGARTPRASSPSLFRLLLEWSLVTPPPGGVTFVIKWSLAFVRHPSTSIGNDNIISLMMCFRRCRRPPHATPPFPGEDKASLWFASRLRMMSIPLLTPSRP